MKKLKICMLLCASICFTFLFMVQYTLMTLRDCCNSNDDDFIPPVHNDTDWLLEDVYVKFESEMTEYGKFNTQMLRKPKKKWNVIIYTPIMYAGLNNRMFALITSFLFSLLTKRGFQMTEWFSLPELFEMPFENFIIEPKRDYAEKYNIYFFNGYKILFKIFKSNSKEIQIGTQYLFTKQIFQYFNNDSYLLSKGYVYRLGDYADMARQFNHLMYNVFFKINQKLLKDYIEYKDKYYFNDNSVYKIGIHYRSGRGDFNDTHQFLKPNQYLEFIQKALIETNKQKQLNKTVVWYIASDWSKAVNLFRNNSKGIECCSIEDIPSVHSGYTEDKELIKKGLYDIMLLAECNYQILTGESSFSYASFLQSKFSLMNITDKTVIIEGSKFVEPM